MALSLLSDVNFNKKRDKSFNRTFDFTISVKAQKEFLKAESYYVDLINHVCKLLT